MAVDFIGFGLSAKPESFSYTLADQADVVERLLSQLHVNKVDVIGHSLGGMVGLLLNLDPSESRLVNLEGNLVAEDAGASRLIAGQGAEEFATAGYNNLLDAVATEEHGQLRRAWLQLVPARVLHATCIDILARTGGCDMIDGMRRRPPTSTLYVCGKKNAWKARSLDQWSGAVSVISGAGHFMLLENPNDTNNTIADFVSPATA